MPCSDSCHKLEDDHAKNHYEDNRKHKLKQHKHITHLFFIFRPMIILSTKHTTITKSEAAIYSNASVYHGAEYDSYSLFMLLILQIWNLSQYSILGLYSLIDNWFIISKSFLSINFHAFRYLQTTIRKLFPKLKCHYR